MEEGNLEIAIILIASIVFIFIILYFVPIGLWFTAKLSGVQITILELIFMKFRRVPPSKIVRSLIASAKGGVIITRAELEAIYLSGSDIDNIVNGLIYAKRKGLNLSLKEATKLDMENVNIIKKLSKE